MLTNFQNSKSQIKQRMAALNLQLNHHRFQLPLSPQNTFNFSHFHPTISISISTHSLHHQKQQNSKSPLMSFARHAILSPNAAVLQDAAATAFVLGGGYTLVSAFDHLTNRNIVPQNLSRKLVHIISGLAFVAAWPLFSTSTEARYFASIAPLTNGLRLVIHGLSLVKNESLIKSVTREGKPEELLRGPLYYVLILAFCAVVFWRDSPVGLLSLAMMSGGDGIADIMGRKFGSAKIPYNENKSWAGSISMFVFGFLISLVMLYYFSALGYLHLNWTTSTVKKVAVVSSVATVVESLPIGKRIDDNISVPLVTMFTAYLCFCL